MKSRIATVVLIILLITTIIPNYIYAIDYQEEVKYEELSKEYGYEEAQKYIDTGKADLKINSTNTTVEVKETMSLGSAGGSTLGFIILLPCMTVHLLMTLVTGSYPDKFFTIEDTVFNKIELFDINFTATPSGSSTNSQIKSSIYTWYYNIRLLAIAISLLMLIYIGIRMALSVLAVDKAKYKKMLIDWLVSFVIIFLLHYFIIIAISIANSIVTLLGNITRNSFEADLVENTLESLITTTGWDLVASVVIYLVLLFYECKFFFIYIKRMLGTGFLILIAPLITVTYAADKANDGKPQAFNNWIKEFLINIYIQPFHALIYLVFINSANEIFKLAPLLAILFFMALSKSEKIIKNIFGMKNMKSLDSMSEVMKFDAKSKF